MLINDQLVIDGGDLDVSFVHLGDQLALVIAGAISQDGDGVAAAEDLDLIRGAAEALGVELIAILVLDDHQCGADSRLLNAVYHCIYWGMLFLSRARPLPRGLFWVVGRAGPYSHLTTKIRQKSSV